MSPKHILVATAFVGTSLAMHLQAQTADQPSRQDEEPTRLTEFVVTGSNIPTAADATDVPVVVLGRRDIEDTGLNANLLDMLRKRIPAFAGRSNAGNTTATNPNAFNTAGGSAIAIRNLDTLVLINGRRAATNGINAYNGKSFVDVNQIPVAAIERMEILTDGASAIYGSDAVGGVVNVILRSNYQGTEVGGRYAVSSNTGHYTERSAYVVAGAGKNGVNITVSGSWLKTDPLMEYQRPFIEYNPRAGTTFPGFVNGNYLNPALNSPSATNPVGTKATAPGMAALIANGTYIAAGSPTIPPFNASPFVNMTWRQEQRAIMANISADLIPKKLVLFADYLYGNTKSSGQTIGFLGNLSTSTVPAGSPFNPTTGPVAGVVIGSVNNPLITRNESTSNRGTLGFRGDLNADWNWEVGGTYSQVRTTQRLVNELFTPNLTAAIAGGYDANGNAVAGGAYSKVFLIDGYPATKTTVIQPALDPFARAGANPASLANLFGTEVIQSQSKLASVDFKIVGTPFELPAGKLGIAVGAATRKETLGGTPDQNSYNTSTSPANHNWGTGGSFFDPFNKSRTIDSEYAEVRVPVTGPNWNVPGIHALEMSLAGRTEKYSDFGKSAVPKIGFRWEPVDEQFVVRFTYSKAFAAPLLYDEFGPPSVLVATGNTFLQTNALPPSGTPDPKLNGLQYFSGNGNNPFLQPTRAWSRSLGVVLSPRAIKGFTLSLNYVNVRQLGLVAGLGANTIVSNVNTLGAASPYFSQLAIGGFPGTAGSTQAPLSAPYGLYNFLASGAYQGNLYVLDHKVNSGGVYVQAIDIAPSYEIPTRTLGTFTIGTVGTYLKSQQISLTAGAPYYELSGYQTNSFTGSGTFPKYSFYTSIDWDQGPWSASVGNRYASSTIDINTNTLPAVYLATNPATKVNYYTSWDLQVGYTLGDRKNARVLDFFRGVKLTVGVNNFFNRMPPYAPKSQGASNISSVNADAGSYSPIGRLYYVSGELKF